MAGGVLRDLMAPWAIWFDGKGVGWDGIGRFGREGDVGWMGWGSRLCVCVGGGGCFGDFVRNFYVLVLGYDVCELGLCRTSFGSIGGVQVYE